MWMGALAIGFHAAAETASLPLPLELPEDGVSYEYECGPKRFVTQQFRESGTTRVKRLETKGKRQTEVTVVVPSITRESVEADAVAPSFVVAPNQLLSSAFLNAHAEKTDAEAVLDVDELEGQKEMVAGRVYRVGFREKIRTRGKVGLQEATADWKIELELKAAGSERVGGRGVRVFDVAETLTRKQGAAVTKKTALRRYSPDLKLYYAYRTGAGEDEMDCKLKRINRPQGAAE